MDQLQVAAVFLLSTIFPSLYFFCRSLCVKRVWTHPPHLAWWFSFENRFNRSHPAIHSYRRVYSVSYPVVSFLTDKRPPVHLLCLACWRTVTPPLGYKVLYIETQTMGFLLIDQSIRLHNPPLVKPNSIYSIYLSNDCYLCEPLDANHSRRVQCRRVTAAAAEAAGHQLAFSLRSLSRGLLSHLLDHACNLALFWTTPQTHPWLLPVHYMHTTRLSLSVFRSLFSSFSLFFSFSCLSSWLIGYGLLLCL